MSTKAKRAVLIGGGALLLALAGVFFYAAVRSMPETNRWWKSASVSAAGVIVDVRQEYRNRAYLYYPVVEFQAKEGKTVRFYPNVFSALPGDFRKGGRIAVRYREGDPGTAYVDSDSLDTATIAATAVFGILLLAFGVLLLALGLRKGAPVSAR
jgi:hypothetical protein